MEVDTGLDNSLAAAPAPEVRLEFWFGPSALRFSRFKTLTPAATIILATPQDLAEMTITAQALQISVPLIVAFHLFRAIVVNMGTQQLYVWTANLLGLSLHESRWWE